MPEGTRLWVHSWRKPALGFIGSTKAHPYYCQWRITVSRSNGLSYIWSQSTIQLSGGSNSTCSRWQTSWTNSMALPPWTSLIWQAAVVSKVRCNFLVSKVKPLTCAGHLFGAMTKKPWWAKLSQSEGRSIFKVMKLSVCVCLLIKWSAHKWSSLFNSRENSPKGGMGQQPFLLTTSPGYGMYMSWQAQPQRKQSWPRKPLSVLSIVMICIFNIRILNF